jgi:MoxR-like ATPase
MGARGIFQTPTPYSLLADTLAQQQQGYQGTWPVTAHAEELRPRDTIYFWRCGTNGGVYAIGTVTGVSRKYRPVSFQEATDFTFNGEQSLPEWSVDFRLDTLLTPLLSHNAVLSVGSKRFALLANTNDSVVPLDSDERAKMRKSLARNYHDFASQTIETILPDPYIRESCLQIFSEIIKIVNVKGPAKWGLTEFNDRLRLNFCSIYLFSIHRDSIWAVVDPAMISQDIQFPFAIHDCWTSWDKKQKHAPQRIQFHCLPELFPLAWPTLKPAFISNIEKENRYWNGFNSSWAAAHSPAAIGYLRQHFDANLPDPSYYKPGESGLPAMNSTMEDMPMEEEPVVALTPETVLPLVMQQFARHGLHYTAEQVATFYTALQTKGFVILSGISGTGKTKLAQHFADLLPQPGKYHQSMPCSNQLFLTVRPDWRDSKSLLGYFNPLTRTYEWTPFLRFITAAQESFQRKDGLAWFVVLDEMNLAHIEYYFADLLSVLESGRDAAGWSREALLLSYPSDVASDLPPPALQLPPNLFIIGTVNVDETTHPLSPKVLDRAFTIELNDVGFMDYPPTLGEKTPLESSTQRALLAAFTENGAFPRVQKARIAACVQRHPELRARLHALNEGLCAFDLHFGYRVFDEILAFVDYAEHNALFTSIGTAFDLAVLMKVLPKFHGARTRLEPALKEVLAWADMPTSNETISFFYSPCNHTRHRAERLLREVQHAGYAAF